MGKKQTEDTGDTTPELVITNDDVIQAGQLGYANGLRAARALLLEQDNDRKGECFLASLRVDELIEKAQSESGS